MDPATCGHCGKRVHGKGVLLTLRCKCGPNGRPVYDAEHEERVKRHIEAVASGKRLFEPEKK